MVQLFFGRAIHILVFLAVLYPTLTAWFLLAVSRNIKRDPAVYELYTPVQALGLAFYLNIILLGFFHWKQNPPFESQGGVGALNLALFFALGLVMFRGRDSMRRRVHEFGERATSWAAAAWPAPYAFTGTVLVGIMTMALIEQHLAPRNDWDLEIAAVRLAFLCLWLVRDVLYLQWMNLRRPRHSLLWGMLYWCVFYLCLLILYAALDVYSAPAKIPFSTILAPWGAFLLNRELWVPHRAAWVLALVLQIVFAGLFAYLHRQKLQELLPSSSAAPAAAD